MCRRLHADALQPDQSPNIQLVIYTGSGDGAACEAPHLMTAFRWDHLVVHHQDMKGLSVRAGGFTGPKQDLTGDVKNAETLLFIKQPGQKWLLHTRGWSQPRERNRKRVEWRRQTPPHTHKAFMKSSQGCDTAAGQTVPPSKGSSEYQ